MTHDLKGKGHLVQLDSAFCVVDALVYMAKEGIYAAAVVKKRRHWPKLVSGTQCEDYMKDKPVGEHHCRRGVIRGIAVDLFAVNNRRYINKMIATYGCNVVVGEPVTSWVARQRSVAIRSCMTAPAPGTLWTTTTITGKVLRTVWRPPGLRVDGTSGNLLSLWGWWRSTASSPQLFQVPKPVVFDDGLSRTAFRGSLGSLAKETRRDEGAEPAEEGEAHGKTQTGECSEKYKSACAKGRWEPSAAPYFRRHCRNCKVAKTLKYCVCRIGLSLDADCFPLHIAEVVTS